MGSIALLSPTLADQIAAGEVVERPASVVKELLENAIDAGATFVQVDVEDGGLHLIRVSDNGTGMAPDDAVLSVQRHATSKIRDIDDLRALESFGFRGEALPSIASVSKFRLITRTADSDAGTEVQITGGGSPVLMPAGRAIGTTMEVRELFYNVPARLKFLKTANTENAHILGVVDRVALASPALHLKVTRDGKMVREYVPQESFEARARHVLGDDVPYVWCAGEHASLTVTALLGAPEHAKASGQNLFFYVNLRPVRDRVLMRAVSHAYGSVLPPGRFPSGVVYLTCDPHDVDVNVHPQKAEVRFADLGRIIGAVQRVLGEALGRARWTSTGHAQHSQRYVPYAEVAALGASTSGVFEQDSRYHPRPSLPFETPASPMLPPPRITGLVEVPSSFPAFDPPSQTIFGSLKVLGQMRSTFIVCESPTGMVILDQHAADERVRYARLRRAYGSGPMAQQPLLVPVEVRLLATQVALIETHQDALEKLGLECGPIAPDTVKVTAVPALLSRANPARLVEDLVSELSREGERAFSDRIDMVLATMACHAALRAGDAMTVEECRALLSALDEVSDFAGHCPHGRPIVSQIGFAELERRVGRTG